MRFIWFIALFFLALPALAQQDMITVDLAQDKIGITTGFTGAHLSLFGVREGEGEVAIVVTGPKHAMTVRKKERIAGAWMNRNWMTFEDVPVYYSYAASVPEEELASPDVLRASGIGRNAMHFKTESWAGRDQQQDFRTALIRNREAAGLISTKAEMLKPLSHNFFRANFYLPANVHPGVYKVQTFYFRKGAVRDVKTNTLRVEHVGTNARILNFARDHAFVYGLLCVALAAFAGWISNRIRRRA